MCTLFTLCFFRNAKTGDAGSTDSVQPVDASPREG